MEENQSTKAALRRSTRLMRASLSQKEQTEKAEQLMQIIMQLPIFINSQHLAAYWPNNGEINPLNIVAAAHEQKKSCYLPKLASDPVVQLQFVEYDPGDYLTKNRLGILEPSLLDRNSIVPTSLDLVLIPLVAFDTQGQRLGMGKGYYDRTFAFRKNNPKAKPFLLGIAYDLQQISEIPLEAWDVSLDGIATETQYIDFQNSPTEESKNI